MADFEGSYDQTYGAFKFLQRPSPGNHEFYSTRGQNGENGIGYFDYFNGYQLDPATGRPVLELVPLSTSSAPRYEPVPRPDGQAGQSGEGWYSYDLGSWHIISLNAECSIGDNAAPPLAPILRRGTSRKLNGWPRIWPTTTRRAPWPTGTNRPGAHRTPR